MPFPFLLAGAAALAAAKGAKSAHAANKTNAFLDAQGEAERKRANAAANIFEAPQIHGAEQRKTFGNLFGQGFLSNFGRDPGTGKVRNEQFGAMLNDPWKYRDIDTLMAMHPTTIKGPKSPRTSVLGSAAMGAVEGGLSAYMAGGGGNPFKGPAAPNTSGSSMFGGGTYGTTTPAFNPEGQFKGFTFVDPGNTNSTNPFYQKPLNPNPFLQ
jgi:hypothetical protein